MQYKLKTPVLNSRRGKYLVATLQNNPMIWTPQKLQIDNDRHIAVLSEIRYAREGRLPDHPYWQNEPEKWVLVYQKFYQRLFSLDWLHANNDRHSLIASEQCCLTLVQYHNHRLIAYSRSTDMKNGYHSDRLLLNGLAEHISKIRLDCEVEKIEWFMAVPHVYEKIGIARLIEKDEETT